MRIEDLSAEELRVLDYVVNYTPSERVETVFGDEIELEDLRDFIKREEKIDDYSNRYEVLSIPDDTKPNVKEKIHECFEELYSESIKDQLKTLFKDRPHDGFQFYNDVSSELDPESDDEASLQPPESEYQDLVSLLEILQELGLGFRRRYLTTTGNYYEEFEFRYHPFNGLAKFLQIAEDIVESHLDNLSSSETWAAYVNAYVSSSVDNNLGGYSPDQIDTALEKPGVRAKENITFLNEEIKEQLHGKLREAIHRDTHYLSTLEFIKAAARQSSQNPRAYTFDQALLEELPSTWNEDLIDYIDQLHNRGLLLDDRNQYLLTEEVISVLDEFEERSKIESYPIETLSDAHDILYQIFAQADEEIKIIDRYFTSDALRMVESNVPNDVRIRVLYSDDVSEGDIENLKNELNERSLDDSKYDIKQMGPLDQESVPHDRFIIIDNHKVWQVGHSLNGLGTAFSTIFSHSEKESSRYVRLFDNLWQAGDDLSW